MRENWGECSHDQPSHYVTIYSGKITMDSRANRRPIPPDQLHSNRFPISDSSIVDLMRMERSIQSLRQQGSLTHASLPLVSNPLGRDLAALRDYLLPLQTDSLLQENRSRMLALSDHVLANNTYPRSNNWILTDHHLLPRTSSTLPLFLFPRERAVQPFFSPSVLDVRQRLSHDQSRGEGIVFQEELSVPSRPTYGETLAAATGKHQDHLPALPPIPFHGRRPALPLNLQLMTAMKTHHSDNADKSEEDASKVSTTSSVPSRKQKAEDELMMSNCKCKSPESSKPYRKHQSENWKERYAELVEFQNQYGHCLVPNVFKENPPLAEWVKRQRYQYKLKKLGEHNSMSDDRIKMLEKLGFVWNSHDLLWEERLNDLKRYKEIHGDCNVPSKYTPNPSLAIWVKRQRRQYKFMTEDKVSTMTRMRIKKLNEIGFSWAARRSTQDRERQKL